MKKGSKMTIESRLKMSAVRKGRIPWNKGKKTGQKTVSPFKVGHTPWNKGKKMTKEYGLRVSASRKGKFFGENHPGWQGGKMAFKKRQAKTRDKNTCQKCGYYNDEFRASAVDVDHILPKKRYPELATDINNLITLCPNCHRIKTLRDGDLIHNKKDI